MNTQPIDCTPGTDPEKELRSDLWPTMSLPQLLQQQEIAITKVSKFATIVGAGAPPSYVAIYNALQEALNVLNNMIDNRSQQKKRKE